MRLILGYLLLFFYSHVWADELPQFFAEDDMMQFQDEALFADAQDMDALEKKKRYVGEDQPVEEHSILDNNFYQDEGFRFYNNTQYSFDEVKNKYFEEQQRQITFEDLSISLGYGMEFKLSDRQSIGYEYISSFPHDRGQSIRFFWKKAF